MNPIVWYYMAGINVLTFFMYGLDKRRARRHEWRISEKTLLLLAAVGGSIGACLGMRYFHHKTRKFWFRIGVPVMLLLQIIVIYFLIK